MTWLPNPPVGAHYFPLVSKAHCLTWIIPHFLVPHTWVLYIHLSFQIRILTPEGRTTPLLLWPPPIVNTYLAKSSNSFLSSLPPFLPLFLPCWPNKWQPGSILAPGILWLRRQCPCPPGTCVPCGFLLNLIKTLWHKGYYSHPLNYSSRMAAHLGHDRLEFRSAQSHLSLTPCLAEIFVELKRAEENNYMSLLERLWPLYAQEVQKPYT